MNLSFYNRYHNKNKLTQESVIDSRNYTYQSIFHIVDRFFDSSGKILDVGCGVGTIDFYLASKGFQVKGIDISGRAIKLALRSKNALGLENVIFEQVDVNEEQLPFLEKFDYVICSEVIEHVENDEKLVNQIYNSLKRDGTLVLSTPLESAPLYRWGLLREFDKRVGHLRRYSIDGLISLIESSGFKVVEIRLTEGLFRNWLYTHDSLGFLIRFIRWPLTIIVNLIDKAFIEFFGASNIYVVAVKK